MTERGRRILIGGLKFGLPLVALAIFASIFLFSNARFSEGVSFDGVDASALDEGLRLTNPSFTGETSKGEPFTVSAAWALPDGPRPETVELSEVAGEIALDDGRTVILEAAAGVLRPDDKRLSLNDGARLSSSDGYSLTARALTFDAATDTLIAEGDVVATGPLGRIAADRMRVERIESEGSAAKGENDAKDAYIWFENRVKVRIDSARLARAPG